MRHATLGDVSTLVHQRREMWRAMGVPDDGLLDEADRDYRGWVRAQLRARTLIGLLVVDEADRVVAGGCLWLSPVPPRPGQGSLPYPYLLSMYTEPGHRGRGLARRIVKEAIRWSRRQGYRRITLHASDEGRALYESFGFVASPKMRLDLVKAKRPRAARRTRTTKDRVAPGRAPGR
jgi:GNAT superfamily N-acetyltransferase